MEQQIDQSIINREVDKLWNKYQTMIWVWLVIAMLIGADLGYSYSNLKTVELEDKLAMQSATCATSSNYKNYGHEL